jgi:type I restriction enzyme S subunit
MTELPPGWAWTTLEDVLAAEKRPITDGPFGSKLATRHYTTSGARVIRLQNIGDGIFRNEQAFISEDYFEELRDHEVRAGDLLLASLGEELPRVCIAPDLGAKAIVKADCIRARIHHQIDIRWVLYALMAPPTREWATSRIKGVGRPRLGMAGIRQIPLPIPPLAEQRRIVAVLEDQLSRIGSCSASIYAALQRSSRLRLRFLADSVASSDKTGSQYLFGQVIKSLRNGMYISRPGAEPDGVPILRIGSVRPLQLDVTDIRYSGRSADEINRDGYLLQSGDLLFTRYNGNAEYVGSCAIVPDGIGSITYPDKLIRVRVNRSYALPEYLALICAAGETRAAIRRSVKTTAGQAGISGRELKNVPVRLPKIEDQKRAVQWFTGQDESMRRLESALASVSRKASVLHMSLLREAFAGRLVEQDSVDEPASVLLERIRAERAVQGPAPRSRRGLGELAPQEEALF